MKEINTIIRPSTREGWLKARETGIGSSEIATVVGLNPWETPYQLWRRKIGLDAPKQENFAMKAGHYLEDAVSQFWADETGREIIKSSAGDWLIRDNEHPFLQVSPDRTYWLTGKKRNDTNKGILECKTTQMQVDGDDIPKHWFCQVQYQLGVAGLEHGSLAWLCCGRDFGYRDIDFVPDFYKWLAEEASKFWHENVLARVEPSAISVRDVLIKYNRHTDGKIIEVGAEIFDACRELKEVKGKIRDLEGDKEALEERIKMVFGDAEGISYDGQTLATWKAPRPGNKFDTKAFTQAHPEMAKEFTIQTQGARRLLLK